MSSSSDTDDIETDGFPPEAANTARFTSIKSTNEVGQGHRMYLPINSWSMDIPPEDMIKNCVKVLKEPTKVTEEEKRLLLEQLESHLSSILDTQSIDSMWYSKSMSTFPKSPCKKPESLKCQSVKINIEIPSPSVSPNNIKYSIEQPIYDNDRACWKTGMDFIFLNNNPPIIESDHEALLENKSTQSEFGFESLRDSFILLQKPIGLDSRSRSEEKLVYPEIINLDSLTERLSTDNEFSFLEKIEENLHDFHTGCRFSTFKSSFRKYKDVIQKSLQKNIQEIKRLKTECEAVIDFSYDRLTEIQFKRHSQNQLLLIDVEQEINFLNADINRKDLKFEKIAKFNSIDDNRKQLEDEIKQTRFVSSLRLISQMITNLKTQVASLTGDLKNPVQTYASIKTPI